MRILVYIMTFFFLSGAIGIQTINECPLVDSHYQCLVADHKTDKGCCDTSGNTHHCECCKILAVLKTENLVEIFSERIPLKKISGETGSPFAYNNKYFHPPEFL